MGTGQNCTRLLNCTKTILTPRYTSYIFAREQIKKKQKEINKKKDKFKKKQKKKLLTEGKG